MSMDKKETILDVLRNIDARISHIEDMTADNRRVILKLVKQGNSIVQFLKELDADSMAEVEYESIESSLPDLPTTEKSKSETALNIDELVNKYLTKKRDLQELEKELEKHKDEITPGIIGES